MPERIQVSGVEIRYHVLANKIKVETGVNEDIGKTVCKTTDNNRFLWGGRVFVYDLGFLFVPAEGCAIDCQAHICATIRGIAVSPSLCRITHEDGSDTSGLILTGQSNGEQDRGLDEGMPFAYIVQRAIY